MFSASMVLYLAGSPHNFRPAPDVGEDHAFGDVVRLGWNEDMICSLILYDGKVRLL